MKTIPIGTIKDVRGRPVRTVERDEDGQVVWKDESREEPRLRIANTIDMMEAVVLNIPNSIRAAKDSIRIPQLFRALNNADGSEAIELHDKVYDWFHRLLNRTITVKDKDIDKNIEMPYAEYLWKSADSFTITEQLKDIDDRRDLDELGDED
jgi:hypothetical protein